MASVAVDPPSEVDVVVVGGGLAGLAAARVIQAAGLSVTVLEGSDGVGGRVRTDHVDGLLLDRGFQLYNPAYPEGERVLDYPALRLQPLVAGLVVSLDGNAARLADPRRKPGWTIQSLSAPLGSPVDKARFAAYAARCAFQSPARLVRAPDVSAADALESAGIGGDLLERVIRPFLAGVFLEEELTTSRHFLDLVLRSFVRGTPSLPAAGMQAIPDQLASRLTPNSVFVQCPVHSVTNGRVVHARGVTTARAVIVATDPASAAVLIPGLEVPFAHDVTTWYHLLSPGERSRHGADGALVVDGRRAGPLVNSVILTGAAPSYASAGRTLVSSSALGLHSDSGDERRVRAHAARLHGVAAASLEPVAVYPVRDALPAMRPPFPVRRPVRVGAGLYVAGDHRDTSSIQGALVSGRRAANALLRIEWGVTP